MSDQPPLRTAALESDIAILGKKGGGKSYTAKGIVELLLSLGHRVCIFDPLGHWYGLRIDAEGGEGLPVAIFGGAHADLPLDVEQAEPMAQLIARSNLPAILDLSELSKKQQQSFLIKFLAELRRVNVDALTIVLEEADVFAPQNPLGDDSQLLHSEIDWIARRGRFRGFRLITITQRPARLSKDVLSQSETLIVHRLTAPQDRAAARAWIEANGDTERGKEVENNLHNLAVGEAWVWTTHDGDSLERVKFPPIRTADTSATPKAGAPTTRYFPPRMIDVASIEASLADLTKRPDGVEGTKSAKPTKKLQISFKEAEERGFAVGFDRGMKEAAEALDSIHQAITALQDQMRLAPELLGTKPPAPAAATSATAATIPAAAMGKGKPASDFDETRSDMREHKPLEPAKTALAMKQGRPFDGGPKQYVHPEFGAVAADLLQAANDVWPAALSWPVLAMMKRRKAFGPQFATARKQLLESGLLREDGKLVRLTAGAGSGGLTAADLLKDSLPEPARKMFRALLERPMSREQLALAVGMQPIGPQWAHGLSILRTNGLTEEDASGLLTIPQTLTSGETAHG